MNLTAEEAAALRKRGKLTKEMRALLMQDHIQKHPTRNEFLVHEPGHPIHVVVQSRTNPAILRCDCILAVWFDKLCSHVVAIQMHEKKRAKSAAQGPQTTAARAPQRNVA